MIAQLVKKVHRLFAGRWEKKVWGWVKHVFGGRTSVSLLEVVEGRCCSIHFHSTRWNRFHVLDAKIRINIYETDSLDLQSTLTLGPGDTYDIEPGIVHQFIVLRPGRLIEVYWNGDGSEVDPDDIIRFEEGRILW